ncbi:MAG TPA: hypothetical protein VFB45_05175 [Pseudolabrys sp.]|nr:hypothetical protein [Pseudolabrys sp.]
METDSDTLRRLHYAAAVACGVLAALAMHILLTVLGVGLSTALRDLIPSAGDQFISSLAWWAIGGAGFVAGWGTGAYLIAATRERELIHRLARRILIAVVLVVTTAAGILSKSGGGPATSEVIASLAALVVGSLTAYCGARFAYLNAEQI